MGHFCFWGIALASSPESQIVPKVSFSLHLSRQPPALQTSTAERAQPHQPSQPRRHRQPPALQTSTVPIRMISPRKTGQKSHKSLSEGCRAKHTNSERPQKHQQRASACVCTTIQLLDVSLHMGHLYFLGWGWVRFGGVG